jgi:hypothetical protein
MSHLLNDEELASFRPILRDLMHSEYKFLTQSIPYKRQAALNPYWAKDVGAAKVPFPAQHLLHCMEVAMVVAGIKPCLVAMHGSWQAFGKVWYNGVFVPWQQKYKNQLDAIGLKGMLTTSGEVARYWDGHPRAHYGGQTAVVYRDSHPLSSFVVRVFTKTRRVTNRELQELFGIPTEDGPLHVEYTLQPPVGPKLGVSRDLCCCCAFEYNTVLHMDALVAAGKHFAHCRKALGKMGIPIGLDIQQPHVSPQDLAILWLATCNGDIDKFMTVQQEEDICWQRDVHPDFRYILHYMRQYSKKWSQVDRAGTPFHGKREMCGYWCGLWLFCGLLVVGWLWVSHYTL